MLVRHRIWIISSVACLALAAVGVASALAGARTVPRVSRAAVAAPAPAADCQPFTRRPCLLPFPNNLFTRQDRTSATGLRVHLPAAAMPTNSKGQRISVVPYDRNDGFSPGSALIVHVPGLDNAAAFAKTHPVSLSDMSKAFATGQPIVVIDEQTGRRQL